MRLYRKENNKNNNKKERKNDIIFSLKYISLRQTFIFIFHKTKMKKINNNNNNNDWNTKSKTMTNEKNDISIWEDGNESTFLVINCGIVIKKKLKFLWEL